MVLHNNRSTVVPVTVISCNFSITRNSIVITVLSPATMMHNLADTAELNHCLGHHCTSVQGIT